jgi:hypothetical protein
MGSRSLRTLKYHLVPGQHERAGRNADLLHSLDRLFCRLFISKNGRGVNENDVNENGEIEPGLPTSKKGRDVFVMWLHLSSPTHNFLGN